MKSPQDCKTLSEVRSEIDRLDQTLIETISQRRAYVQAAARYKSSDSDVHALQRQEQMMAARRQWAEEAGVDPDMIASLFRLMVDHFVALELANPD